MKTARVALLVLAGACGCAAACHAPDVVPDARPFPMCVEKPPTPRAPRAAARTPPLAPRPPPAPELAKLRAYRNYYALEGVGDFGDHFAIWFHCIEGNVAFFEVLADGTVVDEGGAWGGMASAHGRVDIPAGQRASYARVVARHEAQYENAPIVAAEYLGRYRVVRVTEVVPRGAPGDPTLRLAQLATAELHVDEQATSLASPPGDFTHGGTSRLCWPQYDLDLTCAAPRWIDFDLGGDVDVAGGHGGTPHLPALLWTPPPPRVAPDQARFFPSTPRLSAAVRKRFAEAVLAAARARLEGRPGARLDDLLARQSADVVPAFAARPLELSLGLRSPRHGKLDLRMRVPAVDVLRGVAHARADGVIDGHHVVARFDVGAVTPLSADDTGERALDVQVAWEVDDDEGPATGRRTALFHVKALVGRAGAVIEEVSPATAATATRVTLGGDVVDAGLAAFVEEPSAWLWR